MLQLFIEPGFAMAFRADEARDSGYERARAYLLSQHIPSSERTRSENLFHDVVDACGPVVDSYPHWHPLVAAHSDPESPATTPGSRCGYKGLDHTILFAHGFITCPYHDGQDVIDAVGQLPPHPSATVVAERLDGQLYYPGTDPIIVRCLWDRPLPTDGMIPKSWAVPLILERELPCWRSAQVAETWNTMRPYFLGRPHGSRSSLFVDQRTGQVIKNVWNVLIQTGMFGPIRVDFAARP